MNPVIGSAKVDKILTQFSQFYTNPNYISEIILPVLKVVEKTGKFAKYGKENLRAYTDMIYRAPGTRAHQIDYSVSQGDYSCREKALEKLVPDEFANNTDAPYQPKKDATAVLMDNIAINQELALASALGSTGIITQNHTNSGTSLWSDQTNSDPLSDIDTGINTIRASTGQRPNLAVFSFDAFQSFRSHPAIREQVKYTNGGQFSDDAIIAFIKSYFRVSEVLIGEAVYNSAAEGQADVIDDIWTRNVWLMYRASSPTLMKATFGLTLQDVPNIVESYREEPKVSDVVRVRKSYDQTLFDTDLAYLLKNAV